MVSHNELTSLPIHKVWEHFLFKIEHPEHFVPGVSNVIILEKTDTYVMRSMDLTNAEGKTSTIVEKITWQPYEVKFTLIDHPMFEGYVDNLAEAITEQQTRVTFTIVWKNKQTGEPFMNADIPRMAVKKTVEFMEKNS